MRDGFTVAKTAIAYSWLAMLVSACTIFLVLHPDLAVLCSGLLVFFAIIAVIVGLLCVTAWSIVYIIGYIIRLLE